MFVVFFKYHKEKEAAECKGTDLSKTVLIEKKADRKIEEKLARNA